jgi:hypothetical protein
MPRRASPLKFLGGFALGAASLTAYLLWVRPRQLRWGASDEEVARAMPGDEVIASPTFNATRAVTVEAPPEAIWPWLTQVGFGRAGWYSYDYVDNLCRPSADRLIPELQNVSVGDLVPMGPGGMGLKVAAVDRPRILLWGDDNGQTTWVWGLYDQGEGRTRLVSRVRMAYKWTSPVILFDLLLDAGDIVMMRKMMLGIKQRAERLSSNA